MAYKGKGKSAKVDREKGGNRERDFESERINQSFRTREHMASPMMNGKGVLVAVQNAEEYVRHLFPHLQERVLHPEVRDDRN